MNITECRVEGLKVIALQVHGDTRGFFVERFHARHFTEAGLRAEFVQDNHSRSAPGTLRGLHYQQGPSQGKLVGCLRGHVWDVAVDIRPDSSTYGQHFGLELSDANGLLFWIPPGFAHGFCVLGNEPADIFYKVTSYYNPAGEGGIQYDDADIGIDWPVKSPIVSERDRRQPGFADYKKAPVDWAL